MSFSGSLELFFGEANAAETRVYARLTGQGSAGLQLAGEVRGPFCQYAQTLAATIPLVDMGPGASPLAQAIVPDPCFWTPELPYLYRVSVEVRRGRELLETIERPLGIRPLGARGQRLYYEGRPWVLRGVRRADLPQADVSQWHDAPAAMLVENPDDRLCEEASRLGVLLAAVVGGDPPAELRRLARWPAVGFAVLGQSDLLESPRELARNLVLVQRFEGAAAIEPASWADAVLCEVQSLEDFAARLADCPLPVIAYRPAVEPASVAAARRLCDLLQRDLAGGREIAGYVV